MQNDPLISISVTTYNHGPYVRQCLEGIFMQQFSGGFEVLIHDDASTDETKEIIREFVERYPGLLFPIIQEINQYSQGVRGMMARFNFPRARGKYIALCEGDDYWTDPYKLQKQVDFLENNPEFAICFHRAKVLQGEILIQDPLEERYNKITQFPIQKMDLLEQSNFIHTHSVVFRNSWKENPVELSYSPAGDYLMHILVAQHGKIHRLDEAMGVYRLGSGIYSTLDSFNLRKQKLKTEICIVSMLHEADEKEVVLRKIMQTLDRMKNPLAEANRFESLKDIVSIKLMGRILVYKLKKIFLAKR